MFVDEQVEEQGLVAVVGRGEADVALERVGLAADVLELERALLLDVDDAGRQEALDLERDALVARHGGALVEERLTDQGSTSEARPGPGRARWRGPR